MIDEKVMLLSELRCRLIASCFQQPMSAKQLEFKFKILNTRTGGQIPTYNYYTISRELKYLRDLELVFVRTKRKNKEKLYRASLYAYELSGKFWDIVAKKKRSNNNKHNQLQLVDVLQQR